MRPQLDGGVSMNELKKRQEYALSRGRDTAPRSRSVESYQYPSVVQYESRPSTADRAKKHVSFGSTDITFGSTDITFGSTDTTFGSTDTTMASTDTTLGSTDRALGSTSTTLGSTDTTFFHPSPTAPELSSPSYHVTIPIRAPSPPRRPFEPTLVIWDPAQSAPPADSGPEAKGLSISAYESAWDKPFNPNEPSWVPPPRSPLPKGYEYTPPPPPPESHDTSSDSEEEIGESSGYHTSDSESPDDHKARPARGFTPVFPWEMRGQRQTATRVFPGDEPENDKGKAVEARPSDRRASLEKYEFTNAYV